MARLTKEIAKELYLKNFSIESIAEILNKSIKTVKNYKSNDGNWDELKANELIANAKNEGNTIYNSFINEMYAAIKEIREDEKLSSKEKANALSQVGDSFSKMKKVANLEDPKAYKLSIAKEVIKLIVIEFQKNGDKEGLKILVNLFEKSEFVRAIERLD
ncbi:DUF1804 domain-containing protein [Campylobacter blaseri]|uniref:DUF1804 domain-containing protein n=1 Tax=Campylobacter blaseri TaxID=2042961 RepID=A0A2P8QYM8_9BACT|nr:DUF1804 family protein [Campylobacter blaseri]PSM51349.1 hypothetical protein CQ405_08140 [Campylobacter blaseri]PSM52799.1 hypothetical protein CRN67_08145 [Campylobacter blaseri]QKF86099.1 DUF1804 domain-containing protein [Campylobacter blaseri]